jgi:hypothetical protein
MGNIIYFATSVLAGLASNFITIYLQKTNSSISVNWAWIAYLIFMVILGYFAFKHFQKSTIDEKMRKDSVRLQTLSKLHEILVHYASHPDLLHIIDKDGKEFYGGQAGNLYWKEFAKYVVKEMKLTHLRYSNLGDEFQLQDLDSSRLYYIPTDNKLEEKIEVSGIRNGQILLINERHRSQ